MDKSTSSFQINELCTRVLRKRRFIPDGTYVAFTISQKLFAKVACNLNITKHEKVIRIFLIPD